MILSRQAWLRVAVVSGSAVLADAELEATEVPHAEAHHDVQDAASLEHCTRGKREETGLQHKQPHLQPHWPGCTGIATCWRTSWLKLWLDGQ